MGFSAGFLGPIDVFLALSANIWMIVRSFGLWGCGGQ
jgi:hypothetical protein